MILGPPIVSPERLAALSAPVLRRGEIARVVGEGGRTTYGLGRRVIIVRADGRVDRLSPIRHDAFRIDPAELAALQAEIARVDLARLRRGLRRSVRPSAYDGVDETYILPQGVFAAYDYEPDDWSPFLARLSRLGEDRPGRKIVVLAGGAGT